MLSISNYKPFPLLTRTQTWWRMCSGRCSPRCACTPAAARATATAPPTSSRRATPRPCGGFTRLIWISILWWDNFLILNNTMRDRQSWFKTLSSLFKTMNSAASLVDAHETRFGVSLGLGESRAAEVSSDAAAVSLRGNLRRFLKYFLGYIICKSCKRQQLCNVNRSCTWTSCRQVFYYKKFRKFRHVISA